MRLSNSLEILESRIAPAVLLVTSSADNSIEAAGNGTLRGEIATANAAHGADTIEFAHGVTSITLTGGVLDITHKVHIAGPGPSKLSISGGGDSGIFNVSGHGADSVFSGLTLTDGSADTGAEISSSVSITVKNAFITDGVAIDGGGIAITEEGYGVVPADPIPSLHATVLIENSTISDNSASNHGGGIYIADNFGSARIVDSVITDNAATDAGGGVYVADAVHFTLTKSTVSGDNSVTGHGDGFYPGGGLWVNARSTHINRSYIGGNSAGSAGGAYITEEGSGASVTISGSAIDGNVATASGDEGGVGGIGIEASAGAHSTHITSTRILHNISDAFTGGLFLDGGGTTLYRDAITGNTAVGPGGGVFVEGKMNMVRTVVDGNSANGTSDEFGAGGGGIDIFGSEAVTIKSSQILDNSVNVGDSDGGGIYDAAGTGHLTISGDQIAGNKTEGSGGGIAIAPGSENLKTALATPDSLLQALHFVMSHSKVTGNQAGKSGGGLYVYGDVHVNVHGTLFQANTGLDGTGGIALDTSAGIYLTNLNLNSNIGSDGAGGLSVAALSGTPSMAITGGDFAHNQGSTTGGIKIGEDVRAVVQGVTIYANVSAGDLFGAGGFSVAGGPMPVITSAVASTPIVSLVASTVTGNINIGDPSKANVYGDFTATDDVIGGSVASGAA